MVVEATCACLLVVGGLKAGIGFKGVGAPLPGTAKIADPLGSCCRFPLKLVLQDCTRQLAAKAGDPAGVGKGFMVSDTGYRVFGDKVKLAIDAVAKPVAIVVLAPGTGVVGTLAVPAPAGRIPVCFVFITPRLNKGEKGAVVHWLAINTKTAQLDNLGRLFVIESRGITLGSDAVVALGNACVVCLWQTTDQWVLYLVR